MLKKARDWLERRWRVEGIGRHVKMPTILVVRDLAVAERLSCSYSPWRFLVVHNSSLATALGEHSAHLGWRDTVRCAVILSRDVRLAMSLLYRDQQSGGADLPDVQSLEDVIQNRELKRAENLQSVERAAQELVEREVPPDRAETVRLLQGMIQTQFDRPEYFIREAIQNADASAADKCSNRIDVQIRRKEGIIRVMDQGGGMSQDVMERYFFSVFASLNESLDHAAGKFGIGAISFFGLNHEYVKLDSRPVEGSGGVTFIDAELNRPSGFAPNERESCGTTVEIKLSEGAEVDFDQVVAILREDCGYIRTPLYLDLDGSVERLNRELTPPDSSQVLSFRTDALEGFVTRTGQPGKLDLLSHRIRLASVPMPGSDGAVNCDSLDTTMSRDTVVEDPVYSSVIEYVSQQARRLDAMQSVNKRNLSVETRLRDYMDFVRPRLFAEDGSVNEAWIAEHAQTLRNGKRDFERQELDFDLDRYPLSWLLTAMLILVSRYRWIALAILGGLIPLGYAFWSFRYWIWFGPIILAIALSVLAGLEFAVLTFVTRCRRALDLCIVRPSLRSIHCEFVETKSVSKWRMTVAGVLVTAAWAALISAVCVWGPRSHSGRFVVELMADRQEVRTAETANRSAAFEETEITPGPANPETPPDRWSMVLRWTLIAFPFAWLTGFAALRFPWLRPVPYDLNDRAQWQIDTIRSQFPEHPTEVFYTKSLSLLGPRFVCRRNRIALNVFREEMDPYAICLTYATRFLDMKTAGRIARKMSGT